VELHHHYPTLRTGNAFKRDVKFANMNQCKDGFIISVQKCVDRFAEACFDEKSVRDQEGKRSILFKSRMFIRKSKKSQT
jgi:hypothetical protein